MQKESLRETNFEATVTRFEFPRRKVLDPDQWLPRARPSKSGKTLAKLAGTFVSQEFCLGTSSTRLISVPGAAVFAKPTDAGDVPESIP